MAMKYMVAVWEQKGLTSTEKLVALCIADQVDTNGICHWCPINFIIERCNISRSTVFSSIKTLENKNIILRESREANNGGRKSSRYILNSNMIVTLVAEKSHSTPEEISPITGLDSPESGLGGGADSGLTSPTDGRGSPITGLPYNNDLRPSTFTPSPDDVRAAHAKSLNSKIHEDFQRVYDYGCDLFPQLCVKNPSAIHNWLNNGIDADLDIIPEFNACRGQEVEGWGWFTIAVKKAKKARTAVIPEEKEKRSSGVKTFQQMKKERSEEAIRNIEKSLGLTE